MRFHPSQNHPIQQRHGFTLVEILVVIGIIALLSAILFPALARVREGGRTKVCLSNMRQLGMAFIQYTQDSGRVYPGAGQYQKWGNGGHWVAGNNDMDATNNGKLAVLNPSPYVATGKSAKVEEGALYNYAKSPGIYICPSNAEGKIKHLTYSMNCALAGINEVRLTQPSEIILLVDEDRNNDGFWYINPVADTPTLTDELTHTHNGGGNLLFADGHTKFFAFQSFVLDNSNQGRENKIRVEGNPRFFDKTFGANGYWNPSIAPLGTCTAP